MPVAAGVESPLILREVFRVARLGRPTGPGSEKSLHLSPFLRGFRRVFSKIFLIFSFAVCKHSEML